MDMPYGMDRPIQDRKLARSISDIQNVLKRLDYAGYVMLISPKESAWTYKLDTSWSAIYDEPRSPLGIRVRASSHVSGDDEKLRLAAHTFVSMLRASDMLQSMAYGFIKIMKDRGMTIEYERESPPDIIGLDMRGNQ